MVISAIANGTKSLWILMKSLTARITETDTSDAAFPAFAAAGDMVI